MTKPEIYFVTSSGSKVAEYAFWLEDQVNLRWRNFAVEEPLTLNTNLLIRRKVSSSKSYLPDLAFIVEQTVLFLNATRELRLPGTLTGTWMARVGIGGLCSFLDGFSDRSALVRTDLGYHDEGGQTHYFQAEQKGQIIDRPESDEAPSYGWQAVFVPEGAGVVATKIPPEQTQYSTRYRVADQLSKELNSLYQAGHSRLTKDTRVKLLNEMHECLTPGELRTICFSLEIDADDIMPQGMPKTEMIMNLIRYCSNRHMIDKLLDACREVNDSCNWQF